MVVIVFRSKIRQGVDMAALQALGARMYELASAMPGFMSYKDYAAADGESLTLVAFESEPARMAQPSGASLGPGAGSPGLLFRLPHPDLPADPRIQVLRRRRPRGDVLAQASAGSRACRGAAHGSRLTGVSKKGG